MDSEDEATPAVPAAPPPYRSPPPPPQPEPPPPPPDAETKEAPAEPAEEGDDSGGSNALCAQFTIRETGRVAQVLFQPDGVRLNATKVASLCTNTWKLDPPNTLITCDAGTVHPKSFASKMLTQQPQFKEFWEDAKMQSERAGLPDDTAKEEFALKVINDVLFLKMVTIFAAVLDAAEIQKNWIMVDRINSKSPAAEARTPSPPTPIIPHPSPSPLPALARTLVPSSRLRARCAAPCPQLLIEAALAATTSRPTIVVIDSFQRLKNFTRPETIECVKQFKNLSKSHTQPFMTDTPLDCETVPRQYHFESFMKPENVCSHAPTSARAPRLARARVGSLALGAPPPSSRPARSPRTPSSPRILCPGRAVAPAARSPLVAAVLQQADATPGGGRPCTRW